MKILVLILVSLIAHAAEKSGHGKGNGGFAISCGQSVEVLDIYEAKARGLHILSLTKMIRLLK